MKKILLSALVSLATLTSSACWYKYWHFNDYIFGVNNFENHTTAELLEKNEIQYTVKNNQVVDLPISISIHLDSNPVELTEGLDMSLMCALQYRVLPDGEWQTVAERIFEPNSIPQGALPTFYLGRNNINPTGLSEGDVIMIRLYVSRGMKESGDLENLCNAKLIDKKLENDYQYTFNDKEHTSTMYDLGGNWLPHLVTTVVFSGNYRPVR